MLLCAIERSYRGDTFFCGDKMRYLVTSSVLAFVSVSAASAGGLTAPTVEAPVAIVVAAPVAPAAPWAGGYVGANISYGSSDVAAKATDAASGLSTSVTLAEPDGVNFALRAGYDWQVNQWILGLGAEYNLGDYSGSILGSPIDLDVSDVATVFFKAGYVLNEATAIYGLLGYTWVTGEVEVSGNKFEDDLDDWTIGLGLEHRLNDAWSVYSEYTYTDFGTFASEVTSSGVVEGKADLGQFKIGVNYRF